MVEEFETIRHLAEGASVGDAVLAVCGGGLRRHLLALGELPESSLSAITPVSVHQPGALADRMPQMSWLRVQLGTDIEDPVQRLVAIRAQTAATAAATAGDDGAAGGVGHHAATLALSGKMQGLLGLSGARRTPTAACTITNVAGPDVPLYLHGARMTYFSAIMPIHDGMGLVFAVTRYDSRIIISPTSCRELLPDPEGFTQQIRDSFQEYLALARAAAVPRRTPRSARPRASAPGSANPKPPKVRKASTGPRAVPAGQPRSAAPAG
jgi:diacylglycerol O-acyltransferase / wax synthase